MVQHNTEITAAAISGLRLDGIGLEVAPYFDPFIKKSEQNILYTDYISNEEIKAKAAENPSLQGRNAPEIDFVWVPGSALKDCAPTAAFDYIVASHVMEHVPNPVGWLNELLSVTKIGGKVVLFLPDRRLTADYFRDLTNFAELVSLWAQQPDVPTPRQVADFMGASFRNEHGGSNFFHGATAPTSIERSYSDIDAIETAKFVARNNNYLDVHATVWEPQQFVDVFRRLNAAGLLNVDIADPVSDGAEFLVVITKLGDPAILPHNKDQLQRQHSGQHLAEINNQLRVMRIEGAHLQRMIFNDLSFLIQKQHDEHIKLSRQIRGNRPLWRITYDFITSVIPFAERGSERGAGADSRQAR